MRFTKSLAVAASALALATGAAFAGEAPLTDQSAPMGYQPYAYSSYEQGGPELLSDAQEPSDSMDQEYFAQPQEYEVYEVYMVPAEIVLIPIEPREGPISGDELG
jgi:hypothetical protein